MFSDRDAINGERLAVHLLKTCQSEDVNAALIALCMCISHAARAAGIKVDDLSKMLRVFSNTLSGDETTVSAQAAMSSIVLPTW